LVLALGGCGGNEAEGGPGASGTNAASGAGGTGAGGESSAGTGGNAVLDACSPGDTPFVHNEIATGIMPRSVRVLGDLDGDGWSEILIDRDVFRSTGDHGYQAGALDIACGDAEVCEVSAHSIEAADVNGDDAIDLLLNKSVFLNDGAGGFAWAGDLDLPQFYLLDTLIGDVDGDALADIVSVFEDTKECDDLRERREVDGAGQACDPTPALREGVHDECPEGERCFQRSDDSDLGMCHAPRCGYNVVSRGAGDGTFTEASRFEVDRPWWYENERDVASLGDFNGDGSPDLVYRVPFGQTIGSTLLRLGAGDGTFGEAQVIEEQGPSPGVDIYAADLDSDEDLDLVIQPHVLLNDGSGAFTEGPSLGGDIGQLNIPPADVTGDGRPEVVRSVFRTSDSNHDLRALQVDGAGYEALAEWCDPQTVSAVSAADLNGDGPAEVIVAYILKDFRIYQP
jgi:hypothetical protein